MRVLAWSALALALMLAPAHAQAYDPRYPVCMKVYEGGRFGGGGEWIDCSYTSLPQCRATASGRAAMCDLNPYYAPPAPPPRRAHRRHH
ncbi:hypothetical protein SSBR45G_14110 [Bradyrhizobium sp. SSBR45G]|uniref:DUF3551 domain-containing protein n=1 Tax=unclassified Bradyrhizobium TaxID=2631580 RepID=UPI002342B3EB|nr:MULTISPECIES: DUF3551 domain-containing protein [unclassified Bradyrhizobium]GLH76503.1 hypothetical protein SSBR45G_14110 [Bradyrhizobium sp. SSBR45G]GLH84120.1 hypothetical protein SSBR45R_15800 [Bradyrhizobium sp. SSBR45R]